MEKRVVTDDRMPQVSRFIRSVTTGEAAKYYDSIVTVRDAKTGEVKRYETSGGATITGLLGERR